MPLVSFYIPWKHKKTSTGVKKETEYRKRPVSRNGLEDMMKTWTFNPFIPDANKHFAPTETNTNDLKSFTVVKTYIYFKFKFCVYWLFTSNISRFSSNVWGIEIKNCPQISLLVLTEFKQIQ